MEGKVGALRGSAGIALKEVGGGGRRKEWKGERGVCSGGHREEGRVGSTLAGEIWRRSSGGTRVTIGRLGRSRGV